MEPVSKEEFLLKLGQARKCRTGLESLCLHDADISGADFSGLDCQWWDMKNVRLDGCDFEGASIANGKFENCTFVGANFRNAGLQGADLRNADLTGIDLRGGNVYSAWLEGARLDGIIQDESTRYFRLRCPEKGAFIGYKKCYEDRVVMLLIPAEAKRVSATNNACRCDKAKVLTITSFDFTQSYDWAVSLVDENFVYKKGEWMYPDRFTEDRWVESTYGIHFWMSREEAIAY